MCYFKFFFIHCLFPWYFIFNVCLYKAVNKILLGDPLRHTGQVTIKGPTDVYLTCICSVYITLDTGSNLRVKLSKSPVNVG